MIDLPLALLLSLSLLLLSLCLALCHSASLALSLALSLSLSLSCSLALLITLPQSRPPHDHHHEDHRPHRPQTTVFFLSFSRRTPASPGYMAARTATRNDNRGPTAPSYLGSSRIVIDVRVVSKAFHPKAPAVTSAVPSNGGVVVVNQTKTRPCRAKLKAPASARKPRPANKGRSTEGKTGNGPSPSASLNTPASRPLRSP